MEKSWPARGALLVAIVVAAIGGSAAAGSGGPLVVSVAPEPVTASEFKAFGQVVEVSRDREPAFKNAFLRFWSGLAKARFHEKVEFGIMTIKRRVGEVAELHRHAATPKFLVSLNTDFHLVVAPSAPPQATKAQPKAAEVRVFLVKKGQAVVLERRVWHASPFPVEDEGQFIFAFREGTWDKDRVVRAFRGREIVKF